MRLNGAVPARALFVLVLACLSLLSCAHGPAPRTNPVTRGQGPVVVARPDLDDDPPAAARALSNEARAVLREEGDLLYKRYVTGQGPLPAKALEQHEEMFSPHSLDLLAQARRSARGDEARALMLLQSWLVPLAVSRQAAPQIEALERARATLSFAAPGDARPLRGERDLDRLLTDEPSQQRRASIADAEAGAARLLAPLALARDRAEAKAFTDLGLAPWPAQIQQMFGAGPDELARLAEQVLQATEVVARRAVAVAAQQNLGLPPDRVRRADLPRMLRLAGADRELAQGKPWDNVRETLAGMGLAFVLPSTAPPGAPQAGSSDGPQVMLDSAPSPAKGGRPLALLVDPPADVRLSIRPAGGIEEQRSLLHEVARATGGVLTRASRWELAQLGDGSAAEGIAQLFEQLAGDPAWLRARTGLRGETLEEIVHASAARRLLAARRAAALVLFEVQGRQGLRTAEALAPLYRGLLQRATLALFSDADASRWPLEQDGWLGAAVALRAALLAPQLEQTLAAQAAEGPPGDGGGRGPWWRSQGAGARLRQIWEQGRSLPAEEAARDLGAPLGPEPLARAVEGALAYVAPDPRPAAQRPDYRYMQGDRRRVRKRRRKH